MTKPTMVAVIAVAALLSACGERSCIAATGGEKRHQLVVDEFGNVHWQQLGRA